MAIYPNLFKRWLHLNSIILFWLLIYSALKINKYYENYIKKKLYISIDLAISTEFLFYFLNGSKKDWVILPKVETNKHSMFIRILRYKNNLSSLTILDPAFPIFKLNLKHVIVYDRIIWDTIGYEEKKHVLICFEVYFCPFFVQK